MDKKDIEETIAYNVLYNRYFPKWESGEISTKKELKEAIENDIKKMKEGTDPDVAIKHQPRSKSFLSGKK